MLLTCIGDVPVLPRNAGKPSSVHPISLWRHSAQGRTRLHARYFRLRATNCVCLCICFFVFINDVSCPLVVVFEGAMWIEVLADPFVLFCLGCVVTPVAINFETISNEELVSFFGHPAMVFSAFLLVVAVCETKLGKCVKLSFKQRILARWYLLNGVVIHILMDGLVGVFKANRLFAENYAKLDRRYGDELGVFNGSTVHIVSLMELVVKGPVCILLYRAYHRGNPNRDVLEFFTCVTQVYGTIVYLGQEAISGATNLDVDYNLTFSFHYLLYFWFAVIFGCLLYIVVPTILGWNAYKRIVAASGAKRK